MRLLLALVLFAPITVHSADVVISDSGPALTPARESFANRPMVRLGTANRYVQRSTDSTLPYTTSQLVYDPSLPRYPEGSPVTVTMLAPPIIVGEEVPFLVRLWRTLQKPFQPKVEAVPVLEVIRPSK